MPDPRLHIAVDGRELGGQATGVGRYLRGLVDEWSRPDFPHQVSLLAPFPAPDGLSLPAHIHWAEAPAARAGTWWEQTRLPGLIQRIGADVLFAAGYTAPVRTPCPFVLALYDVSFWAHPEWFGAREGLRRRKLTQAAARRAHSVITISRFSATEIARFLEVPAERILLAPPGPPAPRQTPEASRDEIILFVGSLFTRRNIPALIEAFAEVARTRPDARLVLVGDNRTSPPVDPADIAGRLGIGDQVEWRAYVADDELQRLYGRARVFAFLSEYEGFALTPLEALACGVPSVLLDTPVAREVYGQAAELVPIETQSIAGALARLLDDHDRREALLTSGRALLAGLSWASSAAVVQEALERAAASR